ncbi:hypothetical protein Sjap_000049 [Stephania japonica]|uniref:Uncharacterized protein n=1 Tax=Stephania japonica TaxID=461633 RepID=A0AAP0KJ40_9MAGN
MECTLLNLSLKQIDPSLHSVLFKILTVPGPVSSEIMDRYFPFKMPAEEDFASTEECQDQSLQSNVMEEKQISVDPRSLRHLKTPSRLIDDRSLVSPISPAFRDPVGSAKLKLVSASLPNSATSSPRSGTSNLMKNLKKWRNQNQSSLAIQSLARQHSATVSPFAQQQTLGDHFRRSKSCSEGRACAPSDEFDFWATRAMVLQRETGGNIDIAHFDFEGIDHNDINYNLKNREDQSDSLDKAFKCGALCLFLPGFGKGKPVRAIKRREGEVEMRVSNISRTVSLEKFDCGSWASSPRVAAIWSDNESTGLDQSGRSYFDLPMELISDGVNDAHSPVSTAFVFQRDRKGKSTFVRGVKPQESSSSSSRHVRFSTSSNSKSRGNSPSCISPRLRKARDDFNAFLEAQKA